MKTASNCKILIYILLSLYIVFVSAVVIWYVYLYKRKKAGQTVNVIRDPLNIKLFSFPVYGDNCCSTWPITHFFFYLILGAIFPNCVIILITSSIIWELTEFTGGKIIKRFIPEERGAKDEVQYTTWWNSAVSDLFFNLLGISTGLLLRYGYDKISHNKN